MGRILPKMKWLRLGKGGGVIQTIVGGLLGAIAWGIGADIYSRIKAGKQGPESPEPPSWGP